MVVNDIKWVTPNATRLHRLISRTRGSNWEVRCKDSEPQESSLKESKCSAVSIISSGTG